MRLCSCMYSVCIRYIYWRQGEARKAVVDDDDDMPSQQQQVVVAGSTRWCPTPEQLMILEEMYRGGLHTPNSSQIHQITAHLACYGVIKDKNVFYWFQNHKARDRMKHRRRLLMRHHLLSCVQYYAAAVHHGPPPTVAPYGGHHHQLLSPSKSAAAAAAAPAAYGYYYPATAFATPPSRCAGNTTPPSPTTTQLFHYQGGGGGGGLVPLEALGRLDHTSSLGKLDNFAVTLDGDVVSSAAVDVMAAPPMGFEVAPAPGTFCRPLKTLDLFPGGLKEE